MPIPTVDAMRWREQERRHASGVYALRDPIFVRGAGARLWDAEGRVYVDCSAGHGVAALGHGHRALRTALEGQAARLITCPGSHPNDQRAEYLAALCAELPAGLERVFFANSGAEAVEAAIKFARLSTGRQGIVAAMRGFHGRTLGALSATWERRYREPFAPLVPGFAHVPFGSIDGATQVVDEHTAAVLIEIVQGEGGVHPATSAYLHGLAALCRERGALLIVDEVQTGFGRTGRILACEHHDLVPDLLCLGKAMAGGVPMGAVAIGGRVGELRAGAHGSTFGGNPLACAAALTTLRVLREDHLVERAADLGAWLIERLGAIRSPLVREVRGLGLMVGIEIRQRVGPLLRKLLGRGVLALPAGSTVLRLLPPLVIARADLELAANEIEAALGGEH